MSIFGMYFTDILNYDTYYDIIYIMSYLTSISTISIACYSFVKTSSILLPLINKYYVLSIIKANNMLLWIDKFQIIQIEYMFCHTYYIVYQVHTPISRVNDRYLILVDRPN